jgi:hypothetical protein
VSRAQEARGAVDAAAARHKASQPQMAYARRLPPLLLRRYMLRQRAYAAQAPYARYLPPIILSSTPRIFLFSRRLIAAVFPPSTFLLLFVFAYAADVAPAARGAAPPLKIYAIIGGAVPCGSAVRGYVASTLRG